MPAICSSKRRPACWVNTAVIGQRTGSSATRALGSTSEEINLAVERIAAEFKTVRSEISSGSNYADRINALETAVTELTQNQAQIANALAKLGGQTQPF
jgi:archaellum component FlaC